MATALNPALGLTPQQRRRLTDRAHKRQTTFSQELRAAVDLYLDLPPELDKKALASLVREANDPLDRSIAKLDDTLEYLARFREAGA